MRKTSGLIFLMILAGSLSAADTLMIRQIHTGSIYHEGVQRPERTDQVDIWIGDGRVAYVSGPVKIIARLRDDRLILVNSASRTFVEAKLSAPFTAAMTPVDIEATPDHRTSVTVRKTGATRQVLGRTCQEYGMVVRSNLERRVRAWASTDVPFDLSVFVQAQARLNAFLGRLDGASTQALASIAGVVLLREDIGNIKGEILRIRREVTFLGKCAPPSDPYGIPEGFARRTGLSHADLDVIDAIL